VRRVLGLELGLVSLKGIRRRSHIDICGSWNGDNSQAYI